MGIINWQKELLPFEQAVDELIVKFNGIKEIIWGWQTMSYWASWGQSKEVSSILEKLIEEIYLLIKLLINWKI